MVEDESKGKTGETIKEPLRIIAYLMFVGNI